MPTDKPIIVLGAGMAGLLAAAMLRDRCGRIYEAQGQIPNNHNTLLRFRTEAVAHTLNVPFKKVQVLKAVHPWRNRIADAISYSQKTNGSATLRSILSANGEVEERFIAPPDLIDRMSSCVMASFEFGRKISDIEELNEFADGCPIISTLPMPVLMRALDYQAHDQVLDFNSISGFSINVRAEGLDAYCSLYVPDPSCPFSRVSITGDLITIESYDVGIVNKNDIDMEHVIRSALWCLGLEKVVMKEPATLHNHKYGKILPIDENERKRFIMWASDEHQIYSLGRFATWRPGLLLDDVVNDVRVISRLINGGNNYDRKKA